MQLFGKIVQLMHAIPVLQNIRIVFYFYDTLMLRFIKKPKQTTNKKRILVVFPLALGDAVMFYSSLQYLHETFPMEEYDVVLTCHKAYIELFKGHFTSFIPIDYRKVNVNPIYRLQLLKEMRRMHYDVAIDPIGAEECSPNVFVMNAVVASHKAGVLSKQDKKYQCPKWIRNKIYDEIMLEEKNVHKVLHYTNVWSWISKKAYKAEISKLPIGNTLKLPAEYFIIYPSASEPAKCWPVERYAEITKRIYQRTGWSLVLCGTEVDRDRAELLSQLVEGIPTVNMIGKTNIMQMIEVIGKASLVVTNDTSTYHIAVGTGRNTCVVSGGYVYDLFLNYITNDYGVNNVKIVVPKISCMNCANNCIYKVEDMYPCVEKNTIEQVWNHIEELLSNI